VNRLFVYGSLMPGQPNWHVLSRLVVDEGQPATVPGELYDTGEGWPAAVFSHVEARVVGRVVVLLDDPTDEVWRVLDEFEDVPTGRYARIEVVTDDGAVAWAYHATGSPRLERVESGDWAAYRS
jgi:gamma-glutamylcyclotransferase (GGCT)/AIG2-like uncharacterized protein YtfP